MFKYLIHTILFRLKCTFPPFVLGISSFFRFSMGHMGWRYLIVSWSIKKLSLSYFVVVFWEETKKVFLRKFFWKVSSGDSIVGFYLFRMKFWRVFWLLRGSCCSRFRSGFWKLRSEGRVIGSLVGSFWEPTRFSSFLAKTF